MASLELPRAGLGSAQRQVSPSWYYGMKVRPVYKSYPIYGPGSEPAGYIDFLQKQDPRIVFDASTLRTKDDWIRAGGLVFDAPSAYLPFAEHQEIRDPQWYTETGMPVLRDGTMPFRRYVIRKKGVIEIGNLSCATCHTRVTPDGKAIKGAQGNFPLDRAYAWEMRHTPDDAPFPGASGALRRVRDAERFLFEAPWIEPQPLAVNAMSVEDLAAAHAAIPPGVMARHGTSPFQPVKVPDLFGVEHRRYLDATGLVRHRDIGDLMRYAALNQGAEAFGMFGDFQPIRALGIVPPEDPASLGEARYSDEQLYALALYVYALKAPANPNRAGRQAAAGKRIFQREGCSTCHPAPLYANNRLTIVSGFTPPPGATSVDNIMQVSVGTDPSLAMKTRRGTGYYKVPSLKGVWYRGPFEHNGSVATLEEWFDPKRLRDDYIPTGFKAAGVKTRAVPGHEFGLQLSAEDKAALIAFLRTL